MERGCQLHSEVSFSIVSLFCVFGSQFDCMFQISLNLEQKDEQNIKLPYTWFENNY